MAEKPQTIVQPAVPSDSPLGARSETNARSIFSKSPIYQGEISDDERKQYYVDNCLNGTVINGHGVNSFNLDFKGTNQPVPNLEDVETGGQGKPASPFVPNLTSPGPGSVSANDQEEYAGELPSSSPEFGSGLGGTVSPSQTSEQISSQKLGDYITGRSYQGSDGRS